MSRSPPSSAIAASGSSSALPCQPSLFSTAFTPLPLIVRATIAVGRPRRQRLLVRAVDRLDVVPVDLDRSPAERLDAARVRSDVPAVHRLAALAEPVDVEDRDQVVEPGERRVLERLPHRALGELAVAAEAPDAVRQPVELLAGERDADRDRQPLAERARRDVDPGDLRRRVAFEARPELAKREQLLVGDRARRLVDGVEQRRRVALREDEMVVARVVRPVEVVAEVLGEQHRHQVGGRHRGRRMAGLRDGRGADRIHPELLSQLPPELDIGHGVSLRTRRGVT